jgi:hypothetical protein
MENDAADTNAKFKSKTRLKQVVSSFLGAILDAFNFKVPKMLERASKNFYPEKIQTEQETPWLLNVLQLCG